MFHIFASNFTSFEDVCVSIPDPNEKFNFRRESGVKTHPSSKLMKLYSKNLSLFSLNRGKLLFSRQTMYLHQI